MGNFSNYSFSANEMVAILNQTVYYEIYLQHAYSHLVHVQLFLDCVTLTTELFNTNVEYTWYNS